MISSWLLLDGNTITRSKGARMPLLRSVLQQSRFTTMHLENARAGGALTAAIDSIRATEADHLDGSISLCPGEALLDRM